ncbi:unnamed protein product [Amoebophrya sp. A25]|nr:unnamed protein product [Amoebophrya sp. A25]|eukprot:GSA25T00013099001.1
MDRLNNGSPRPPCTNPKRATGAEEADAAPHKKCKLDKSPREEALFRVASPSSRARREVDQCPANTSASQCAPAQFGSVRGEINGAAASSSTARDGLLPVIRVDASRNGVEPTAAERQIGNRAEGNDLRLLDDEDEESSDAESDLAQDFIDEEEETGAESLDDSAGPDLSHLPPVSQEVVPAEGQPRNCPRQGQRGFNRFYRSLLQEEGFFNDRPANNGEESLQLLPHQEVVLYGLHSGFTPRILVDHRTGAGKTLTMIKTLDTFLMCPWPKIVILPTETLRRNFLQELIKFPSSVRRFWAAYYPQAAAEACGCDNWASPGRINAIWTPKRGMIQSMSDLIALKGKLRSNAIRPRALEEHAEAYPGIQMPRAPIRIMSYGRAGGSAMQPSNPDVVLRFGKEAPPEGEEWTASALWSNAVVLLDEAHNVSRSNSQYATQLERLRKALQSTSSRDTRVAMFTATPAGDRCETARCVQEGTKMLLDALKGRPDAPRVCDEGFVSHFDQQDGNFPSVRSVRQQGETLLGNVRSYKKAVVRRVTMGSAVALRYARTHLVTQGSTSSTLTIERRKRARCGMWLPPQSATRAENVEFLSGTLAAEYATKAYEAGREICRKKQKSLVLCRKRDGLKATALVLRSQLEPLGFNVKVLTDKSQAAAAMQDFNSQNNVYGERVLVLIADVESCGEGVSFFQVRHCHILSLPESATEFHQWLGRCNRYQSHQALPAAADKTIQYYLYVAELPKQWRPNNPDPSKPTHDWAFVRTLMLPSIRQREEHNFLSDVERLMEAYESSSDILEDHTRVKRELRDDLLLELDIKSFADDAGAFRWLRRTQDEAHVQRLAEQIETSEEAMANWRRSAAFDWDCYSGEN